MIVAAPLPPHAGPSGGLDAVPPAARFRQLIADNLGLQFEDDKLSWLADLMRHRAQLTAHTDPQRYLDRLGADQGSPEWEALLPDLTVAETYFFRHREQFDALSRHILPEVARKTLPVRPLRVLSAGCATGEEAYSIAMTIASMPELEGRDVRIDAIDINPLVLARARAGRYRGWSLRETPEAMSQRWFTKVGQDYLLDARIRAMVRFAPCNLADRNDPFWLPEQYDIVLCRNVLMYFGTPRMRQALATLAHAMTRGGYLLMGHAESLRGLSSDFQLRHGHGTFYYQLASADEKGAAAPLGSQADAVGSPDRPSAIEGQGLNWVQAIGQSAERVRALSTERGQPANPSAEDTNAADGPMQGPAGELLALFDREQFQEALNRFEAAHAVQAETTPWLQVLHALLLMHVGRLADAEALCRGHLASQPFHADLHHALALCLEAGGRLDEAMESDRTAGFIDPAFAMPHVNLGMLARRRGDPAASRRACAMALRLLPHESADRIRLFAGGFSREALHALCEAERHIEGEGR